MKNSAHNKEYIDDLEEKEDLSWQMKVETLQDSLYHYDKYYFTEVLERGDE